MTIKKFQGRTREEATERAKAELGEDAVIMNVKEIVPKGVFRSFKKSIFEVTAAVEEKESRVDSGIAFKNMQNMQKVHETINMASRFRFRPYRRNRRIKAKRNRARLSF